MPEFQGQFQGGIAGRAESLLLQPRQRRETARYYSAWQRGLGKLATVDSGRRSPDKESPVKTRIAAAHCLPADIRFQFRIGRSRRRGLGRCTRNMHGSGS